MDADANRLRMFGGDCIGHRPSLRPAYLGLLRLSWPNWDIDWAHDGIVELREFTFGVSRRVDELDLAVMIKSCDECRARAPLSKREPLPFPEWNQGQDVAVVSFVSNAAGVSDHIVPSDTVTELLGYGPDLAQHLGERFRGALPAAEDNLMIRGGAIVEPEWRRLTVWFERARLMDMGYIALRWPGWTLLRQNEGLALHAAQTGRERSRYQPTTEAAIAQILREIDDERLFRELPEVERVIQGADPTNEARRLADHLLKWSLL